MTTTRRGQLVVAAWLTALAMVAAAWLVAASHGDSVWWILTQGTTVAATATDGVVLCRRVASNRASSTKRDPLPPG